MKLRDNKFMRKRQKGFSTLLVFLTLALLLGAFVYSGKLPLSFQTGSPTQKTDQVDETANWKTYKDNQTGIEFKYPETWYLQRLPNWTFEVFLDDHQFTVPANTTFKPTILISFNEVENTVTNQKYFREETLAEEVKRITNLFDPSTVKIKDIMVGGKQAKQISGINGPGIGVGEYTSWTLVQMDKKILEIYSNKESESLANQILSTFKFNK